MSKEELFKFIKEKTYLEFDRDNGQTKITAQEIIGNIKGNEATIYKNLKKITKWPGMYHETWRINRYKEGKKLTFKQTYYWIE